MMNDLIWLLIGASIGVAGSAAWMMMRRRSNAWKARKMGEKAAVTMGEIWQRQLDEALVRHAFSPTPEELKAHMKSGIEGPCMVQHVAEVDDE